MASSIIESRGLNIREYTVNMSENTAVSPFSYFGVVSLSNDVNTYGEPIGIVLDTSNSSNTCSYGYSVNEKQLRVYGSRNFNIKAFVAYLKVGGVNTKVFNPSIPLRWAA